MTVIYVLLAALGLSFLIFIHEMGHYLVARRQKMRVDVFSIGFGKPIVSWMRNGVKWQVCWFLFGGYVKIAGMQREEGKEPHEVQDGFYSKSPWARIQVVAMGPIVNIVAAFLLFTALWMMGGRMKPFSQFTQIIGAVAPKSELYKEGVRAGDEVTRLNGHPYRGFEDLMLAGAMQNTKIGVEGYMVDYYTGQREPFSLKVQPYSDPSLFPKGLNSLGILTPASYLLFDRGNDMYDPLAQGAPMAGSGIQEGDRIIWANGELLFSTPRLSQIVNEESALLTIARGGKQFLVKVPRLQVADIRLTALEREELDDWQHEVGLSGSVRGLRFIPYALTGDLRVERSFSFVDEEAKVSSVKERSRTSHLDILLRPGDRIVAVDGIAVKTGYDFLQTLQKKHVQMIVQRNVSDKKIFWNEEDAVFLRSIDEEHLSQMVASLPYAPKSQIGDLVLLKPVSPVQMRDLPLAPEQKDRLLAAYAAQKAEVEKRKSGPEREQAMQALEASQSRLTLGLMPRDKQVVYNPGPMTLCNDVFQRTIQTLSNLVSGKLHPKWLAGPVGMVHIMQQSWTVGFREALYWLGAISLSLGIFNLFPLPILDGGHICFAVYEWVTKKRVSFKLMERLIVPFFVLMIGFAIYLTFNDVSRLFAIFK